MLLLILGCAAAFFAIVLSPAHAKAKAPEQPQVKCFPMDQIVQGLGANAGETIHWGGFNSQEVATLLFQSDQTGTWTIVQFMKAQKCGIVVASGVGGTSPKPALGI